MCPTPNEPSLTNNLRKFDRAAAELRLNPTAARAVLSNTSVNGDTAHSVQALFSRAWREMNALA
jgi:hypothetical protein